MSKPIAKFRKKTVRGESVNDNIEIKTTWMRMMRQDLFNNEKPSNASQVVLLARLLVNCPEPKWPLLVQTMLCQKMSVAKLIMTHFGAFIPGNRGDNASGTAVHQVAKCETEISIMILTST